MRFMLRLFVALVALLAVAIAGIVLFVIVPAWRDLPDLDPLTNYRPRLPMRVVTADGFLIKEFGEERRIFVRIENVPANLKNALIAAEDERFYEHHGLNMVCIWSFLVGKPKPHCGRTITGMVAVNFFLPKDPRRRFVHELLLSLKIERNLSKDKILELYVNQIYLGHRAFGFAAASRVYFDKPLADVTLAESAMLAGLPRAPSMINPISDPIRSKRRQAYVLKRMLELGYIDEEQYKQALDEPLNVAHVQPQKPLVHADYVAEMARRFAVDRLGEQAMEQGVEVVTTITRTEQETAYEAVRAGVMRYDRSRGYRGPEKYIELPDGKLDADRLDEEFAKAIDEDERLRDHDDMLLAVVTAAAPKEVTVYRNGQCLKVSGEGLRLAARQLAENAPKRVRRGALVRIRNIGEKGWEITQLPEIDAALISIDSRSGAVRALVGGFGSSQFNNATMARRLPDVGHSLVFNEGSDTKAGRTPWEMAHAYAVFANGGYDVSPYVVAEIRDADGKTLARADPLVSGKNAPLKIDDKARMDSLRRSLLNDASSRRAAAMLKRADIAGKSSPTDDHTDLWFAGYGAKGNVVAVAWMGYPIPRSMGKKETGISTALPIWADYMRVALQPSKP